jgi:chaperonin cofactor prefoldin
MSSLEAVQKKLSQEISKFGSLQKTYQKTLQMRQQLDSQLNENNIVKEVNHSLFMIRFI